MDRPQFHVRNICLVMLGYLLISLEFNGGNCYNHNHSFHSSHSTTRHHTSSHTSSHKNNRHHHHHHRHSKLTKRQVPSNGTQGLVIRTKTGLVQGVRNYLPGLEKTVDTYWGIPFAKPPMGALRFRLPVPAENWSHVYQAVNPPKACPLNLDLMFDKFKGADMWNDHNMSEDCLYLNVFVHRKINKNSNYYEGPKKHAVMVWIYGGGFYSGSSTLEMYDGKYLAATSDVIVVSMNYRLGALGFFSMDNAYTPANVGLYDQLAALEWVQNNIHEFGGDPDNVTIFGESAGSVSVSLHLLSPLSRHKFHRAILQSGTAIMPWAVVGLEEARRRSHELATVLACNGSTVNETIACMLQVPWSSIVDNQWQTRGLLQFPFVPSIDGVFLPDDPKRLVEKGNFKKCPILAGSNMNEASFFLMYDLYEYVNLTHAHMNREEFKTGLSKVFYFYPQYPLEMPEIGHQAILNRYSPAWANYNDTFQNLHSIDMASSDAQFLCPMNNFIAAYAREGLDTFSYYFTHRIKKHPWPEWMGVVHADEIFFTINHVIEWGLNLYTRDEIQLSGRLIKFWTNFAKTGDPNDHTDHNSDYPVWPKYSPSKMEYLKLNAEYLNASNSWIAKGQALRVDECGFWDKYMSELLKHECPTPSIQDDTSTSGNTDGTAGTSNKGKNSSPPSLSPSVVFLSTVMLVVVALLGDGGGLLQK